MNMHMHTALVEAGYHPDNCYHNCTHAADVTQALHCLLLESKVCVRMRVVLHLYIALTQVYMIFVLWN